MNHQVQVPKERYDVVMSRYKQYLENVGDPDKPAIRVFDPLSKKSMDELELIREVSKTLQIKKEEDLMKAAAAQAAEAVEVEATETKEAEATETTEAEATETTEVKD